MFIMYRIYLKYQQKNRLQSWLSWFFLGAFVVFLLFVTEVFPGASAYYDYRYSKRILGKGMLLNEIYAHEGPRDFLLGDGYSLYVYGMSESNASSFYEPHETFFSNYPSKTRSGSKSQRRSWTRTPLVSSDSLFRRFALQEWDYSMFGQRTPVVKTKTDRIEELMGTLLEEEGNYYAYDAYMHGTSTVGNISFYVLSPKDKWLMVIYFDT